MKTIYGRSPWIDRFPKSRMPSYPRYRGDVQAEAVIIGGGLTGCATAYALAANGIRPVLLEAGQIGRGSSGHSAGWIGDDPGVPFASIEKLHGRRAARHVWQSWRRAALDFVALLRRLEIRCDVQPHPGAIVATRLDETVALKRDARARRDAGMDAVLLNARAIGSEFGITASVGRRLKDGSTLNPYRATLGLALAALSRGAQVFERSPVAKVTFDRKIADVHTAGGRLRTRHVIVATGGPTALYRSLVRHFYLRTAYAALTEPIGARVRRQLGARRSVLRDTHTPPHIVRWVDDERLLITGADLDAPPARLRDRTIVQRTGQLMYELSLLYPDISGTMPAYGWDAAYARTADGLPYIGPHRNFPHQFFAWGDAGHSLAGSYLASRMALRHVSGELDRADDAFAFTR